MGLELTLSFENQGLNMIEMKAKKTKIWGNLTETSDKNREANAIFLSPAFYTLATEYFIDAIEGEKMQQTTSFIETENLKTVLLYAESSKRFY
ncbi:hypothetical protein NPIL_221121 [Nephila pilipes]|uniref:Uncharacterized protein n=1 Tax=Nephila pilipes TaxID=299642 RepID=A0A8X6MUB6_NEPPI|nr:hypothetical protein NPIL_221121 [Nephila pilipes]